MRKIKLYEIRITPAGHTYSVSASRKLRSFNRARRLVSWLKSRGHDACYASLAVIAS